MFSTGLTILSNVNPLNATQLKCLSMNSQECKVRPDIVNFNRDETVFYPFSIKTSKCSGSCNNINYLYLNICGTCVCQELMKHSTWKDIKRVSVNVD